MTKNGTNSKKIVTKVLTKLVLYVKLLNESKIKYLSDKILN